MKFVFVCYSRFKILYSWIVGRDIYQIYFDERMNLKKLFRTNTQIVSITTIHEHHGINYLCIATHFIDQELKLHKKIISFSLLLHIRGITKALETCLLELGLKSVFTITIDKASSRFCVGFFQKKRSYCLGVLLLILLSAHICIRDAFHTF